jgi:hypothetical protein
MGNSFEVQSFTMSDPNQNPKDENNQEPKENPNED